MGPFTPSAFDTNCCEVSLKLHPAGEQWPTHYHRWVTEINLLIDGTMVIQGRQLEAGTIFVLEPYEIADPLFLTDCRIICVKVPGNAGNDKVIVEPKELS